MMDAPTLADEKWVRIMADFCADGIWAKDGCGTSADQLPISDGLRQSLRDWQAEYDERGGEMDPEWTAWGRSIATLIKRELPDWTVFYFDESKRPNGDWGPGTDRSSFEYEIQG